MVPLGYCSGWVAGHSLAGPVGFAISDICIYCVKWAIELSTQSHTFSTFSTQDFFSFPQNYLERHLEWRRLPEMKVWHVENMVRIGLPWCLHLLAFITKLPSTSCYFLMKLKRQCSFAFKPRALVSRVLLDRSSGTPRLPSSPQSLTLSAACLYWPLYSLIYETFWYVVFVFLNVLSVLQEHHSDVNDDDSEDEQDMESDAERPAPRHLAHHAHRSVPGRQACWSDEAHRQTGHMTKWLC